MAQRSDHVQFDLNLIKNFPQKNNNDHVFSPTTRPPKKGKGYGRKLDLKCGLPSYPRRKQEQPTNKLRSVIMLDKEKIVLNKSWSRHKNNTHD